MRRARAHGLIHRGFGFRVFATAMVTMAGVDLLAKFHAGSDQIGQVGPRIKDFARTFMFAGAADPERYAEVLYLGLRNPLLHSFTVYNEHLTIWVVSGRPQAAVYPNPQDPNHFILSIEGIYAIFVQAVNAYHAALLATQDLQQKFEAMY
jgi:hypothetical protein